MTAADRMADTTWSTIRKSITEADEAVAALVEHADQLEQLDSFDAVVQLLGDPTVADLAARAADRLVFVEQLTGIR